MPDPILVLGMHRSGTGLVARALEHLGVFMGAELDPNHEAYFFVELNQFALDQCGARWDHPEGVEELLQHPQLRRILQGHFRFMVDSPLMRRYTGSRWRSGTAGLERLGRWGWKDPRTVLLTPLWLDVFPDARVIHVRRHGVDVASSLRARHQRVLDHTLSLLRQDNLYSWKEPYRPLIDTVRAATLAGGFALWEQYLETAERHLSNIDRVELRYEEFVQDPTENARVLMDFLELDPPAGGLEAVTKMADPDRAFAYRHDPELIRFADAMADRLAPHGYGR